jgi:hypothetical protein
LLPEVLVVVHDRQPLPIFPAVVERHASRVVARVAHRDPAVRTRPDRARPRHRLLRPRRRIDNPQRRQALVLAIQQPAFADREDRFSLIAKVAQVVHELIQRLERHTLAPPRDHLGDNLALRGRRKADLVLPLALVLLESEALTPRPDVHQPAFEHLGLAREDDVGGGHARGHHPDEVVGAQNLIDQPDERPSDLPRRLHRDVLRVEEEHEHPIPRVRRHVAGLP